MKNVNVAFEIINTKIVAKVEGYTHPLTEEQLLDYFRLLDVEDDLKAATEPSDIEQLSDRADRLKARLEKPYDYMSYHSVGK